MRHAELMDKKYQDLLKLAKNMGLKTSFPKKEELVDQIVKEEERVAAVVKAEESAKRVKSDPKEAKLQELNAMSEDELKDAAEDADLDYDDYDTIPELITAIFNKLFSVPPVVEDDDEPAVADKAKAAKKAAAERKAKRASIQELTEPQQAILNRFKAGELTKSEAIRKLYRNDTKIGTIARTMKVHYSHAYCVVDKFRKTLLTFKEDSK